MDSVFVYVALAVALLAILAVLAVVLLGRRGESKALPRPGIDYAPGVGDDDTVPRDTPRRSVEQTIDVSLLEGTEPPPVVSDDVAGDDRESVWEIEIPESAAGRLTRLRRRLARSQSSLGRGLLTLLSRDTIDAATWDEVEETLLSADLGVAASTDLMERLRARVLAESPSSPEAALSWRTRSSSARRGRRA